MSALICDIDSRFLTVRSQHYINSWNDYSIFWNAFFTVFLNLRFFAFIFRGDLKLMKRTQFALLFLLTILVLSAVPASFISAAEETNNDQTEDEAGAQIRNKAAKRTQMMFEIANRTMTRIEQLIKSTNETLMETLENATLLHEFNNSVIHFEEAKSLLEEASAAISSGDYNNASRIISESMKIFREVYGAIYRMTETHTAAVRNRMITRGLIVAMQRALERVERLKELAEGDENAAILLDEAEQCLNILAAEGMLAEGDVTGVSHNLAKANQLINEACLLLKEKASKGIWARVRNYLNIMERACQRIGESISFARRRGINVAALLGELGYKNETQFRETLQSMIMAARGKAKDIKEALQELQNISRAFWTVNKALTRQMHRHQSSHHESWGGQGQGQSESQSQNQNQNWAHGGAGGGEAGLGKGGSSNSYAKGHKHDKL